MKTLFKLIILALAVYGGWWLWKNYDFQGWYQNCKNHPLNRTRECIKMPQKRGAQIQNEATIYLKDNCEISQAQITIEKDQIVTWYNQSKTDYIIQADNFYSYLNPGKSFSKKYNETGTFSYTYCGEEKGSPSATIIVK